MGRCMEVTISIDDLHPEKGWGCKGDESVKYLEKLNEEFGCKFTLFTPSNYHKKYPLSKHKDWVDFWLEKDWVELSAHGHYHMCDDSNRFGECEFAELDNHKTAKDRIQRCLSEWDSVGHKPIGWRNPGWLIHPNSKEVVDKYFDYVALHNEHNHNMEWKSKMFFGHDSIHDTDISLHDGRIMFQSHIAGDWNDNVWNEENYLQFRNSIIYLLDNYDVRFKTLGEITNVKNVIYLINVGQLGYTEHTIPLIKKYSEKVDADIIEFGDKEFIDSGYPSPNFLIFDIWKHFEDSKYDKMMYIDVDIRILDHSPNIFDEVKNFGMVEDWKAPLWRKEELQKWFDKYWSGLECKHYFNGGLQVISKDSIKILNELVPSDIIEYWNRYPDGKLRSQNQGLINKFLAMSGIDYQALDDKWNKCCRNKPSEKDYFIHYVANKSQIQTEYDCFKDNVFNPNIEMRLDTLR